MIAYSRFSSLNAGETGSTAAGKPSYEVDVPNAGTTYVIGNVIQQPAVNSNATLLAYGEEGASNVGKDLYVINNTFLNDKGSGGTFLFIGSGVTTPALAQNNIFGGVGNFSTQSTTIDKTNYRAAAPSFANRAAYDLHPTGSALVIDAGSDPGKSASGVSLAPVAQYKHVASGEGRTVVNGKLDIGAYEATGTTTTTTTTTPTTGTTTPTTGTTTPTTGTTVPTTNDPTVTWTWCSVQGGTCKFSGTREVRYGAMGTYYTKVVTGSIVCTNEVWGGNPTPGYGKNCYYSSKTQ
jgi:hypothetical protein